MRHAAVLAAAFAAFAATPALAADPAQLSCPRDQLSAAQREGLDAAARRMVEMSDSRIVALTQALADCARRHGWSENEREMARRYHLSLALVSGTRPLLVAAGMDLAAMEREIIADEVLIRRIQASTDGTAVTGIVDRHSDLIMRTLGGRGDSLAESFGAYLGAFAVQEASRRSFSED